VDLMTTRNREWIASSFNNRNDEERAVGALRAAGFQDEEVGWAARDQDAPTGTKDVSDDVAKGASAGAATGGALGAAGAAAAMALIPGVGPFLAGGYLGTIFITAGASAAAGGLLGGLAGMGFEEGEARHYDEEFKSGRTIGTVRAGGRETEALSILQQYGGRSYQPANSTTMRC
jgi:hypothetical protein